MVHSSAKRAEVLVAVGFAEALSAPEVVWSLVDAGYDVIAFSRRGRHAALRYSRHVRIREITAPEHDCAAALADLAAVLESASRGAHSHHVLLPLDDSGVWLCSNMPAHLGWIQAGPTGSRAELALDKQKQIEKALAAGFSVPATSIASTQEELFNCIAKFQSSFGP